ncbi:ABC transporter substrate-binding protein [Amantichitinum ursilacus]|uniref:Multiple sugar-binding protein n=1 Tax=Amantichitinum ursilacus TaxID=857265 RepID=A0A0N1JSY9_9NEIS|nr:sugar ABC transporter substrate-binding protein [Amantichitinum ursilacus]KPC53430.1 Multiple sugar-binding protein precursor [Amantichitinum ursilacus]
MNFSGRATLQLGASLLMLASAWAQADDNVTFWVRMQDSAVAQPLVKAWNGSHKEQISLTVIPNDDFITKFGTAAASGNVPDILAVDLIYVPQLAKAGQLTDITDKAKALPFANTLSKAHMRLANANGRQYALPFSAEGSVLLYNKGLYKKAGLDPNNPPKDWATIEANAKKITALGGGVKGFYFSGACGGCQIFTFAPYIWASGGDILSADGKTATLDKPQVKDALEFYHRMWSSGQISAGSKTDNGQNFINTFLTGKVGMVGTGAFAIGLLKREHPEIDFGITPFPGEKGGTGSFAGGDSIAIPKGSKHADVAYQFMTWCLSDAVQTEYFAKNGSIPVRSDLGPAYYKDDPRLKIAFDAFSAGQAPYSDKFPQLINDNNGPWATLVQDAVYGGDVNAAVKKAQTRFNEILSSK